MSYDAYKTEFRVELQYLQREAYAVRGTANSLRSALTLLARIDVTNVKRESLSKDEYGLAYFVISDYFDSLDKIEDLERQETALIHAIQELDEVYGFSDNSVGDLDQQNIDITYAHLEAADRLDAADNEKPPAQSSVVCLSCGQGTIG
ncbi:hypothetical protein [Pannonibacter phragmitetus]|uniref:hypothetical protein n=1 Tax=Pannonibacter phragmitetus TaxID=121719 RepID=UPI0011C01E49|nr:hypothetical protein [Pannonibacter phragmitetus]